MSQSQQNIDGKSDFFVFIRVLRTRQHIQDATLLAMLSVFFTETYCSIEIAHQKGIFGTSLSRISEPVF